MDSAIHLPDDPGARSGVALYTIPETLRTGSGRRTLRMTGCVVWLRSAAGT